MPIAQSLTGFMERLKGKSLVSSSALQQIGKASALTYGGGNVFSALLQAGQGNGADTTEDVLFTCTIPANTLDIVGREIGIQAWGSILGTSATKTIKVYFGSTVVATLTATTTQSGDWSVNTTVVKAGSSQQSSVNQTDTTVSGSNVRNMAVSSPNENDQAGIVIKVTGQSSVATAGLVNCKGLIVSGYN